MIGAFFFKEGEIITAAGTLAMFLPAEMLFWACEDVGRDALRL